MNEVRGLDLAAGGVAQGPKLAVMRSGQQIFTAGVRVAPAPRSLAEMVEAVMDTAERQEPATEVLTRSSSVVETVRAALADRRFDFRRPETIAEEVDLPVREVESILLKGNIARRPWGRPTATIFTAAEKPVTFRERISLVDVFLAKRPD